MGNQSPFLASALQSGFLGRVIERQFVCMENDAVKDCTLIIFLLLLKPKLSIFILKKKKSPGSDPVALDGEWAGSVQPWAVSMV